MGIFGQFVLCVSALTSAAGGAVLLWSDGEDRRVRAGTALLNAAAIAAGVALVMLAYLLVTHDYSISYVREQADRSMPLSYLITGVWGGQEGSLLFWAALQTFFTAAVIRWPGKHAKSFLPVALSVMAMIQASFLLLVIFQSNPFAELGTEALRGQGINPLLRNPYIVFHPPSLFVGYVGLTVPFAYVLGHLAEGVHGDDWVDALRPWVLVAWVFLSIGNILGMLWAYEELGWGGYWAWDPVENAAFLPWLIATALLHTLLVRRHRGGFRLWTVVLAVLGFELVVFGTFLNRSGIIDSVHSFAGASTGSYFLAIIIVSTLLATALAIWRRSLLAEEPEEPKPFWRRENIFLIVNVTFIVAAIFVWMGTMMPFFSNLISGEKIVVTAAAFNRMMAPTGLVILLLLATGLLVGWQAVRLKRLGKRAITPLVVGALTATVAAFGGGIPAGADGLMTTLPLVSFALVGTVGAVVLREVHKILTSKGNSNAPARRRRLGGQLAHLAVVLMFLGFTGSAYTIERTEALSPGESMELGDFQIEMLGLREDTNTERLARITDLEVRKGKKVLGIYSPALNHYHSHPDQPTLEGALRRRLSEDVFLVLGEIDTMGRRAMIRGLVNPLVSWIWLGGILMVFGGFLALFPAGVNISLLNLDWSSKRTVAEVAWGAALVIVFTSALELYSLAVALVSLAGMLLLALVAHLGLSFNNLINSGGDL